MTVIARRLRPVLISLVVLAVTAGLALAGQPAGAPGLERAPGLDRASAAAGKDLPVGAPAADEASGEDADTETDEPEAPEAETDESNDGAEHCATDPRTLTPDELAAMNHGAMVCWAAHQPTPDGYANHGAWVSEWAHQNHGQSKAAKNKGQGHGGTGD